MDGPCDLTKPYIARPSNSRKFHIFNPDGRAFCSKLALLFPDAMACVPWTGTETRRDDDCAGCFNKAAKVIAKGA